MKVLYSKGGGVNYVDSDLLKMTNSFVAGNYRVSLPPQGELVITTKSMGEVLKPIKSESLINFENYLDIFLNKAPKMKELKLKSMLGLLLYGKPGTMKTSYCKYLCEKLVKKNKAIVVTGQHFEAVLEFTDLVRTHQDNLIVLFLDEFDFLVAEFGEEVRTFLDGFYEVDNVLILATTNDYINLDPCFKRPSRFKFCIETKGLETIESVQELLETYGVEHLGVDKFLNKSIDECKEIITDHLLGFDKIVENKKQIGFI